MMMLLSLRSYRRGFQSRVAGRLIAVWYFSVASIGWTAEAKPASLRTTFTGDYKWYAGGADQAVTLTVEKLVNSGGVIHFSGHDTYTAESGPDGKNTMQVQGDINTNDNTIAFSESHPSNPIGAATDGIFKGTITPDLRVITAAWTNTTNGTKLGDLRLTVGAPDTPPAGVMGEEQDDALSAQDLSWIKNMSIILLRDIDPSYPGRISIFQHRVSQRKMETDKGRVLWGNLFTGSEIVALTNLAPEPAGPYDYPPQYLCLFVWKPDDVINAAREWLAKGQPHYLPMRDEQGAMAERGLASRKQRAQTPEREYGTTQERVPGSRQTAENPRSMAQRPGSGTGEPAAAPIGGAGAEGANPWAEPLAIVQQAADALRERRPRANLVADPEAELAEIRRESARIHYNPAAMAAEARIIQERGGDGIGWLHAAFDEEDGS